jgi:DNA-binding CsgD family transcriptional regulator
MSAHALYPDAAAMTAGEAPRPGPRAGVSALPRQGADPADTVADGLRAALDVLGFGLLIVDLAAKVLAVNRAADALLRRADGLRSCRGRLRCEAPRETRALHDAVRAAAGPACNPGRPAIHVGVTRGVAHRPLTVHVVPLASLSAKGRPSPRGGLAAVFLVDPMGGAGDVEGVARAYRLTPSESRVVAHIAAGRGLVEAAAQLRIAMPTVRTHLQHIFSKTGTGNQAELVRLVVKSSLPLWPAGA